MSEQNFEQIYQQYFEPVYRYALSLTLDEHQAEEITQETFFKALKSIDSYRSESSIKTWLCTIAKNMFLSEQRKKKAESLDDLTERVDESAGPEEQAITHTESIYLHRLLHDLSEPYKEVFSLRVFAQLSFRDIGSLFGKSENWACVTFHRAKSKVQEQWEESK